MFKVGDIVIADGIMKLPAGYSITTPNAICFVRRLMDKTRMEVEVVRGINGHKPRIGSYFVVSCHFFKHYKPFSEYKERCC